MPPALSPILLPQWSLAPQPHSHHRWALLQAAFYTRLRHLCTQTIQLHRCRFFHSSCDQFALPRCFILSYEPCFEAFGWSSENAGKNPSFTSPLLAFYFIALLNLKDDACPCCQGVVHCCFGEIVESDPENVNVDFSFTVCLMGCCLHLREQYYEYKNLVEKCLFDSGVMDWTQCHRCQRCTVMTVGARARAIWLDVCIDFIFLSSSCWPLSRFRASWYSRLNGHSESFLLHSCVLNSCYCIADFDFDSACASNSCPFCSAQVGSSCLAHHKLQFQ